MMLISAISTYLYLIDSKVAGGGDVGEYSATYFTFVRALISHPFNEAFSVSFTEITLAAAGALFQKLLWKNMKGVCKCFVFRCLYFFFFITIHL